MGAYMKVRLMLAAGAATAVALAGAGSANALIGVNVAGGGNDSSNGADNGIHDTKKVQFWDCEADALTDTRPAANSRYVEYGGPKEIWPPNHKMRTVNVTAWGDADDAITLAVNATHDQMVAGEEMNGSGNTEVDFVDTTGPGAATGTGKAVETVQIRGERSGRDKTGRTYTVAFLATYNTAEEECDGEFTALVPHDQRNQTNTGSQKPGGGKTKKARKARRARR